MPSNLCAIVVPLMLSIFVTNALKPIPDFIHVCKANDPLLADCISASIMSLREQLSVGIPEMGIPTLEPLDIGNLMVTKRRTPNGLQISANNIKAYNSSQYEVYNLKVVEHGRKYTYNMHFKTMYVTGTYEMDGYILMLPIRGSGKFSGLFHDAISTNSIEFEPQLRDGIAYCHFKNVDSRIKLGGGQVKLENLFGGDPILGDTINDAINANFEMFAEDIIPLVEKALNKVFIRLGDQICSPYTMQQLFDPK